MRRGVAALLLLACGAAAAQSTALDAYLQRFDGNGDGRVSQAEYVAYMLRGFDRMDRNGNGWLDADEVPRAGPHFRPTSRAMQRANLIRAFQRQDVNRDGFLDAREMALPPQ